MTGGHPGPVIRTGGTTREPPGTAGPSEGERRRGAFAASGRLCCAHRWVRQRSAPNVEAGFDPPRAFRVQHSTSGRGVAAEKSFWSKDLASTTSCPATALSPTGRPRTTPFPSRFMKSGGLARDDPAKLDEAGSSTNSQARRPTAAVRRRSDEVAARGDAGRPMGRRPIPAPPPLTLRRTRARRTAPFARCRRRSARPRRSPPRRPTVRSRRRRRASRGRSG